MSGFGVILMLLCDGLIANAANRNASSILSWQEARGKRRDDLPSNPILLHKYICAVRAPRAGYIVNPDLSRTIEAFSYLSAKPAPNSMLLLVKETSAGYALVSS
jgi:hypothetical protein